MAAPELVVRVFANLDQLKVAMAEGGNVINATSQALAKLSAGYDGSKIIQQANATAAAIQQVGGVTSLTAAEQSKANAILEQALAKYAALGRDAPPWMKQLADATKATTDTGQGFLGWLHEMGSSFVARVAEGMLLRDAMRQVISIGKELTIDVINQASHYKDLSQASGLSLDQLQRFTYVAKDFGVGVDEVTRGVEQLGTKLAKGDDSAVDAVRRLGLGFEQIRNMAPADAFNTLIAAVSRMHDPMERSATLADLFGGKLGKMLGQLPDLTKALNDVPKGAIISDEAIDSLDRGQEAWEHFWDGIKGHIGNYLGALAQMIDKQRELADLRDQEGTDHYDPFGTHRFGLDTPHYRGPQGDFAQLMGPGFNAPGQPFGIADPFKPIVYSAAQLKGAITDLTIEYDKHKASVKAVEDILEQGPGLGLFKGFTAAEVAVRELEGSISVAKFAILSTLGTPGWLGSTSANGSPIGLINSNMLIAGAQGRMGAGAGESFGQMLSPTLAGAPGMLIQALLNGGGLKGGLEGVASSAGSALGGGLGKTIGGLGSLGGPVGAALGSLAGPLLDNLLSVGGPSGAEVQSRSDRAGFMGQFAGFDDMMAKVGKALQDTGVNASQADLIIRHMLDAKTPADFAHALDPITHALDQQQTAQTALNDALGRYHFTIEQLGPALQRQNLDQQAQQLFKDWNVLNAAQIKTPDILQQMSGNMSTFVQQSIRMGVEIPVAMKGMLEQAAKAGQLFDENGNKIEDLNASGITWATTMTQGFKDVVDSIKQLSETITNNLAHAFDVAAESAANLGHVIPGGGGDDVMRAKFGGNFAATGGWVTATGIQAFAGGGRVLSFPRAMGTDTVPAMLTPGELVLNRAQQQAVFGGGGVSEHHHHLYIDGREVAHAVTRVTDRDLQTRRKMRAA